MKIIKTTSVILFAFCILLPALIVSYADITRPLTILFDDAWDKFREQFREIILESMGFNPSVYDNARLEFIVSVDGQTEAFFEYNDIFEYMAGRLDPYGRIHGEIDTHLGTGPPETPEDTVISYKKAGSYNDGLRHGLQEYYYPDGSLYGTVYYENGGRIESDPIGKPGDSNMLNVTGVESEVLSFQMLQYNYPWFLFKMEAYGYASDRVMEFMSDLQSRIITYSPWSESDFTEAFANSVSDLRDNDSLFVGTYEFIVSIEGLKHWRNFEIHRAVIERYLESNESTYEILEQNYPDFLESLPQVIRGGPIQVFIDDLDSRMDEMGPVDMEDPAYVEEIRGRILEIVGNMFGEFSHIIVLLALQVEIRDMLYASNPVHESLKAAYFVTSVDDDGGETLQVPALITLEQNYPNPFNPVTNIRYSVPEQMPVRLTVFDTVGKEIAVLVDKEKSPGIHEVAFDGSHLASGVYLYQLRAGDHVDTKRLVLVK